MDIKKYYEKDATRYDTSRFSCRCRRMYDDLEKQLIYNFFDRCKTILDVGCGTGRVGIYLAKKGKKVVCCDSSKTMLKLAKKNARKNNVKIKFLQGNIENIPFKDNSFDGVVSIRVLMHFKNLKNILREMARVSKKTIVFDFFDSKYLTLNRILFKSRGFQCYGHTYNEVNKILTNEGVVIVNNKRQIKLPFVIVHFLVCKLNLYKPMKAFERKFNFGSTIFIRGELD